MNPRSIGKALITGVGVLAGAFLFGALCVTAFITGVCVAIHVMG